jgi:hypothetical protein
MASRRKPGAVVWVLLVVAAGAGWLTPAEARHDDVECRAYADGGYGRDRGYRSCGECTDRHGSCVERCYQAGYACEAIGHSYYGHRQRFEGFATSRRRARQEALDRCYYGGGRDCRVTDCGEAQREISQRRCETGRPRGRPSEPPVTSDRCRRYPIGCGPGYSDERLRGIDCEGRSEIGCLCWKGLGSKAACDRYYERKRQGKPPESGGDPCQEYPIGCGPGYTDPRLQGIDCQGRTQIGCLCWKGLASERECREYREKKKR